MSEDEKGQWERHLQSWMLGLITLGLLYFGLGSARTSAQVDVIVERLNNIEEGIKSKMLDRYTGSEAGAHEKLQNWRQQQVDIEIKENRDRIKQVEDRLNGSD